jgi:DNA polymerase III alpha subunit (gram-positive type)
MSALDVVTGVWRWLATGEETPLDRLTTGGFVATAVLASGADPRRDEIVAVAAAVFLEGRQGPSLTTLVRPQRPIPAAATAVHGIDDSATAGAPPLARVLPRFDALCARRFVVAHDAAFQAAVLGVARGPRISMAPRLTLDTRALARAAGIADGDVEAVAAALHVPVASEGALVERRARTAGEILLALLPRLRARGARTVRDLVLLQRTAASPR